MSSLTEFFLFSLGCIILYWFYSRSKSKPELPPEALTFLTHELLEAEIDFYTRLSVVEKPRFITEMKTFLMNTRIVGVDTEVTDLDRLYIGASGVIPIFYFEDWHFYELDEVMLYAGPINTDFETNQPDSNILGMVGTGKMEGKMALSRLALSEGFRIKTDVHNTALHEFVHLVDKADGRIDGLPKALMDKPYAIPWLQLARYHIAKIKAGHSNVDEYGATNLSEFFAVAAEYFFERPDLLKERHPDLYKALDQMFKGKLTE